jgi:hypothetical protein
MFLEQVQRCLAVPTRTKQCPDRADHSCVQLQRAVVSRYLTAQYVTHMSTIELGSKGGRLRPVAYPGFFRAAAGRGGGVFRQGV